MYFVLLHVWEILEFNESHFTFIVRITVSGTSSDKSHEEVLLNSFSTDKAIGPLLLHMAIASSA